MKQLFFSFLCCVLTNAPSFAWQNHPWSHFSNSMKVNKMVEHQQQLWMGTDKGVFVMDKVSKQVTHYNKSNSGLHSNHIQTISKDAQGNLWIGTYDLAVAKVPASGGAWEIIPYPAVGGYFLAYCSKVAPDGHLWMGTSNGLIEYDGYAWTHHPISGTSIDQSPIWEIDITSTGTIYAASNNLLKYQNQTWTELNADTTPNTMAAYSDAGLCLQNDSTVWYFTDLHNYKYDGQQWQEWFEDSTLGYPVLPAEVNLNVFNAKATNDGGFYYGGYNTLVHYDGYQWTVDNSFMNFGTMVEQFHIDDAQQTWAIGKNQWAVNHAGTVTNNTFAPLYDVSIFSYLASDKYQKLYSSVYSSGIYELSTTNTTWQNTQAVANGTPIGIYEELVFDAENEMWFISRINGKLAIIEQRGSSWIIHDSSSTNGLLPSQRPNGGYTYFLTMAANHAGTIWVLDEHYTIYQYKNNAWSVVTSLAPFTISDFTTDAQGNFWWVGRDANYVYSLHKYDGTSFSSYVCPGGDAYLIRPTADANGNIWIITANDQIAKFDGNTWQSYSYANSLAQPTKLLVRNNNVYISTDGAGLFIFDGTNWDNITAANSELENDAIRKMEFDEYGSLWMSNINGNLDVWHLGELLSVQQPSTLKNNSSLTLFPNPATSTLTLQHPLDGSEQIQVLNAQGQCLMNIAAIAGTQQHIDISVLANGIYWMQVRSDKSQTVGVFVKK